MSFFLPETRSGASSAFKRVIKIKLRKKKEEKEEEKEGEKKEDVKEEEGEKKEDVKEARVRVRVAPKLIFRERSNAAD